LVGQDGVVEQPLVNERRASSRADDEIGSRANEVRLALRSVEIMGGVSSRTITVFVE